MNESPMGPGALHLLSTHPTVLQGLGIQPQEHGLWGSQKMLEARQEKMLVGEGSEAFLPSEPHSLQEIKRFHLY